MKDRIKNENLKIDKFYNLITETQTDYGDGLLELTDLILKVKEEGKIDDDEMNLLLKFVLSKETKKEIQGLNKWMEVLSENKDKYSMLFNISSKEKKYA